MYKKFVMPIMDTIALCFPCCNTIMWDSGVGVEMFCCYDWTGGRRDGEVVMCIPCLTLYFLVYYTLRSASINYTAIVWGVSF